MRRRDKRSCNSSRGRSSHLYNVALRVPLTTNRSEAGGTATLARGPWKREVFFHPLFTKRGHGVILSAAGAKDLLSRRCEGRFSRGGGHRETSAKPAFLPPPSRVTTFATLLRSRPRMPLADWLIPEFDEEMAATRRVLERVPDGKAAWKPHPKSMTLGRLATLVAELPAWAVNAVTRDELDIMPPGGPAPKFAALESTARILELFDRNAAEARAAIARTADPEFQKPWAFKVAGRTVNTSPKFTVYRRTVLNHLVHHRGQLTVYLRLNGIPVPAVYGPTADEPHF